MIHEENRRLDQIRECAVVNGPLLHGEISVTSGRHGCKLFGSHRSIFTDTANSGRKVRPTVFPECNYVRESHTCQFFRFFIPVISCRTTVT